VKESKGESESEKRESASGVDLKYFKYFSRNFTYILQNIFFTLVTLIIFCLQVIPWVCFPRPCVDRTNIFEVVHPARTLNTERTKCDK